MGTTEAMRDELIAADVRDIFANDRRLPPSAIEVAVRGGVVHLAGEVAAAPQRDAFRSSAARVRGVHAVWDLIDVCGAPPLRCIDLGSGAHKQAERSIGLDFINRGSADVLADLDKGLPFADHSIDRVFAVHILEHVRDLFALLAEIHRVLRPDGVLHVMVPDSRHVNALADPTHIRFFNVQTFKHFCRPQYHQLPYCPLSVSTDGASIFADLRPVQRGDEASDFALARFFD